MWNNIIVLITLNQKLQLHHLPNFNLLFCWQFGEAQKWKLKLFGGILDKQEIHKEADEK